MGNPHHDARGRFSSGVGGGSRAKGATSPAKRMAQGRAVATIGNETMVMSKKHTPEQTRSKAAAAGARAKMRKAQVNPSRGVGGAKAIADKMAKSGPITPGPRSDPRTQPAGAWHSRGVGGRKVQRIQQGAAWRLKRSN
jgi:hypothetical protein